MTNLQLASRTHQGDVYITPPARRHGGGRAQGAHEGTGGGQAAPAAGSRCVGGRVGPRPPPLPGQVSSGPATLTAEPGLKPEGRFYTVIGGETSNDNRLYELRFTPPSLSLLTETRRVSSVSACRDRVVVAAGQPEVGFTDHLQELGGDTLLPLEGIGAQPGFTPDLNDQCRLTYTWVDRDTGSLEFELRGYRGGGRWCCGAARRGGSSSGASHTRRPLPPLRRTRRPPRTRPLNLDPPSSGRLGSC